MEDRPRKSDLLDLTVQLHHETERAVLVSDDGNRQAAVWLPKASIEIEMKPKGVAIVTLPEWLAIAKGLV